MEYGAPHRVLYITARKATQGRGESKAAKVILDAHPSIYEKGLCLREVGRGTIGRRPRNRVDHSTDGSLGGQIEDMASASEEPFVATYKSP
jgi:hypothetical protein